ncbi:MAG: ABC transporter substrate-binding protein [Ruminococcus sp.]|nr:ABC transporter substrate-binding protein [Ruminococcus sp.]MCM1381324.1 ABC transporter substrate-binding protein [Muribaculaceae bacterium]MCM1479112.1 ABC transporter substrate-binding protein [Muribaculaceae bacterium]
MLKIKKYISLLLAAAVALGLLGGCTENKNKNERERVTVALWSDQLTEQYGAFLRDKFPEVDFTFYVALNSADFYRFKNEQDDLPDILTLRRFALRDVAELKGSLMDLGGTELAEGFSQSYLRSYTYDDGTVNWLPTCAEVDSIILNKTLFEENGIAVPTTYEEFLTACDEFRQKGIRPFMSNFGADYTCMEILQGLSAAALSSQSGREWRQSYESGQTDFLDEDVWLPVFERMAEFIDRAGLTAADLELSDRDVYDEYKKGNAAMFRGTGDDTETYGSETESVLLPYFGDTENDSRYLTYPAFQIAASNRAEESPEREKLILDIISAMLSEEGLRKIAANQNMVSYSSEVNIDMSPSMESVKPYAENNLLYIRLASADMFSASQTVVQGMINGEYPDGKAALDAFNGQLANDGSSGIASAYIDRDYSYAFDPEGGCEAASALMNTVREEIGTEFLIAPAAYAAGNIAKGYYTEEELRFLAMGESVSTLSCNMTGEQLYRYIEYVFAAEGKRGSVVNSSTLYVSSGFEMSVKKTADGYVPEKLTAGGNELDREKTYSVTVIGNLPLMLRDAFEEIGVTEYSEGEDFRKVISNRLAAGGQLAEPTKYITLK